MTSDLLSINVLSQLISQEPNQGVEYEYYLPHGRSREGYYWSFGSWSACSRDCGSGQSRSRAAIESLLLHNNFIKAACSSWSGYQSRLVFCTIDNEAYPDYLCASLPRPQTNRTCNPHPCPQTRRYAPGLISSVQLIVPVLCVGTNDSQSSSLSPPCHGVWKDGVPVCTTVVESLTRCQSLCTQVTRIWLRGCF